MVDWLEADPPTPAASPNSLRISRKPKVVVVVVFFCFLFENRCVFHWFFCFRWIIVHLEIHLRKMIPDRKIWRYLLELGRFNHHLGVFFCSLFILYDPSKLEQVRGHHTVQSKRSSCKLKCERLPLCTEFFCLTWTCPTWINTYISKR